MESIFFIKRLANVKRLIFKFKINITIFFDNDEPQAQSYYSYFNY